MDSQQLARSQSPIKDGMQPVHDPGRQTIDAAQIFGRPGHTVQTGLDSFPGELSRLQDVVTTIGRVAGNFDISGAKIYSLLGDYGLTSDPRISVLAAGLTNISKNGNEFDIQRTRPLTLAFNHSLLSGLAEVQSLNVGNMKFDLVQNGAVTELNNLTGLSVTVSSEGQKDELPVKEVAVSHDAIGDTILKASLANPLPWQAQYLLDMQPTVPITMTISPTGSISLPAAGEILQSAAGVTGGTFPGLVAQDELINASSIVDFMQKYPQWIKDTVQSNFSNFATDVNNTGQTETASSPSTHKTGQSDTASSSDVHHSAKSNPAPDNTEPNYPPIPDHITKGGTFSENIEVNGAERHYLLFVPSNYNPSKPMPLVLALHGLGKNSYYFKDVTGLDQIAQKEGFIVAYPDATRWLGPHGWTAWDTNNGIIPPTDSADDVKFLETVIDRTQKEANIDPNRIYMFAHSNGGMMTYDALSALSSKVAAVVVVSGAMSGRETSPKEPVSVLNIHGTADDTIPYEGITNVPNILSALELPTFQPFDYVGNYWRKEDKITAPPITTRKGREIFQTSVNPQDGATVEQETVLGGPHTPPNFPQVAQAAWQFLAAHPKIKLTKENTPPTIKPILGEPTNPLNNILDDLHKRGVTGLENDFVRVVQVLPSLPNGSIDPEQVVAKFGNSLSPNTATKFLSSTESVSKMGHHYQLQRKTADHIPLNFKIPGTAGLVSLDRLNIGNVGFNMTTDRNGVNINKISGLSANLDLAGYQVTIRPLSLNEQPLPNGGHQYQLSVSQPLPAWARFILMEPDHIPVDITFNSQGTPRVVDQNLIENAVIGRNPFIRGGFDEIDDVDQVVSDPSVHHVENVGKDAAITTAAVVAGRMLGNVAGGWTKLGITVGFLAAPAIIDGVDKLFNQK